MTNRNPTAYAAATHSGASFPATAPGGFPTTGPGGQTDARATDRVIAGRFTGVLRGRRARRPSIPVRCAGRPRRRIAAALLCCAVQVGFLQVTPASAQELEPTIAEQTQAAGININTASAEELAAGLNGVGASKALAIVRYREQFGDFESIDELTEVGGIGAATVERNRALLKLR